MSEQEAQSPVVEAGEEEMEGENTPGYKVAEKVSKDELLQKDADDSSLNTWKQKLLAGAEGVKTDDPRNVVIREMSVVVEGRPDLTYTLDTDAGVKNMETTPVVIKEGATYKLRVKFHVQHDIVMGLKYLQVVKRKGLKVDKSQTMVGCYGPQAETHEFVFPEETAPSGLISRGSYSVTSKFTDDDKNDHLTWTWKLEIKKDWE
eukprot:GCRY01001210.1.p1 GENE.GCRY01001210.1~~GCRY01001210.1.p1  ORF type:complete len:204 (-),score=29.62 GCRY01001210.1:70-681(-)